MKILHLYDILKKPINTSKSCMLGNLGKYVFITGISTNKSQVARVVEKLFGIKVKKVSIINSLGKLKLFKGVHGNMVNKKKFYISIYNN